LRGKTALFLGKTRVEIESTILQMAFMALDRAFTVV
jgi:hypothetical protein